MIPCLVTPQGRRLIFPSRALLPRSGDEGGAHGLGGQQPHVEAGTAPRPLPSSDLLRIVRPPEGRHDEPCGGRQCAP